MDETLLRKLIVAELDDKWRGPTFITVPHNIDYQQCQALMRQMAHEGHIQQHPRRGLYRRKP